MAQSNIPAERISKFSVVEAQPRPTAPRRLLRIIEKPDAATLARLPRPLGVSMNCWRFGPSIFEACRQIKPSPRGELELPDAVQYAIDRLGERFGIVWCKAPVLDLSSRNDIEPVARRLKGVKVELGRSGQRRSVFSGQPSYPEWARRLRSRTSCRKMRPRLVIQSILEGPHDPSEGRRVRRPCLRYESNTTHDRSVNSITSARAILSGCCDGAQSTPSAA